MWALCGAWRPASNLCWQLVAQWVQVVTRRLSCEYGGVLVYWCSFVATTCVLVKNNRAVRAETPLCIIAPVVGMGRSGCGTVLRGLLVECTVFACWLSLTSDGGDRLQTIVAASRKLQLRDPGRLFKMKCMYGCRIG